MALDLSCYKEVQWDGMESLMLKELASRMACDLSCLSSCQWEGI